MALKDLSEVAASNTSIDGTNVGEGTAMSNLNNGIRAVSAILRQAIAGDSDTVPSSPTCDIASPLSNFISISGQSQINGFSAGSPGLIKFLQFQSILNIVHSASILCPGAATISTLANDIAMVRYESSTITRLIGLTRSDGVPLTTPGLPSALAGSFASQAQMEAATVTNLIVSPGLAHHHPGISKAWLYAEVTGGTPIFRAGYNFSSVITDNAAGDYSLRLQSPLSSANFGVFITPFDNVAVTIPRLAAKTNSVLQIQLTNTAGATTDAAGFFVNVLGDM